MERGNRAKKECCLAIQDKQIFLPASDFSFLHSMQLPPDKQSLGAAHLKSKLAQITGREGLSPFSPKLSLLHSFTQFRGGSRGRVQGVCTPLPEVTGWLFNTTGILPKNNCAHPPKKNPRSTPAGLLHTLWACNNLQAQAFFRLEVLHK